MAYETHGSRLGSVPRLIVMASATPDGFVTEVVGTSHFAGPNRPFVTGTGPVVRVEWTDDEGVVRSIRRSSRAGAP